MLHLEPGTYCNLPPFSGPPFAFLLLENRPLEKSDYNHMILNGIFESSEGVDGPKSAKMETGDLLWRCT